MTRGFLAEGSDERRYTGAEVPPGRIAMYHAWIGQRTGGGMWQSIKIILAFAFVAPPIVATIACAAPLSTRAVGGLNSSLQFLLPQLRYCAVEGVLSGYFFGFVPAALAGAVLAIIFSSPARRHLAVVSVISGAVALVVVGLPMYALATKEVLITAIGAAVAGLIAGNICWRLAIWQRRPNGQGA